MLAFFLCVLNIKCKLNHSRIEIHSLSFKYESIQGFIYNIIIPELITPIFINNGSTLGQALYPLPPVICLCNN